MKAFRWIDGTGKVHSSGSTVTLVLSKWDNNTGSIDFNTTVLITTNNPIYVY